MALFTILVDNRTVAVSTKNQALNAILYHHRLVFEMTISWLDGVERAKKPKHLPVVLTRDEVKALLASQDGREWLMAEMLYGGCEVRLTEWVRLRVKGIDFEMWQIIIRDATGQ